MPALARPALLALVVSIAPAACRDEPTRGTVSEGLGRRDASGALGLVSAVRDATSRVEPGGSLHVFALP